jgi:hypothetical protein
MFYMKKLILSLFALLIFMSVGCADKKSAAQIEDLKKELAALKSNSKNADDILVLKAAFDSLKAELEAAKKLQLADSRTLQQSQDKINELSQLSQVHDNGSRALSQRIDLLINSLPIPELVSWKSAGLLECRQLTLKEANSASTTTITPTSINLSKSGDSYVFVGALGEFQGLLAKSESGYIASLSVGKNESELTTVAPNESFTKAFSRQDVGGFKSAAKDEDKQSVSLVQMKDKGEALIIGNQKNSLFAKSDGLTFSKGDQEVIMIEHQKRGASMRFFDVVGDSPKIILSLRDDNGEPFIAVQGATKFDILYPTIERTK